MDKKPEKKPKFFCEACGSEVRQNDKFCKHCGKFFASVKCPQCNKTGDAAFFSKGCPVCGYAVLPNGQAHTSHAQNNDRKKNTFYSKKKKTHTNDPLPPWIYIASVLLTIAVLLFTIRYLSI